MRNKKEIIIRDTSYPGIVSCILAALISTVMSTGFILMLSTSFKLDYSIMTVLLWTVIPSLIFVLVYFLSIKPLTLGFLIGTPAVITLACVFDVFDAKLGVSSFLFYVQNHVIYSLPGEFETSADSHDLILMFLMHYNMIAISFTVYAILKRKFILSSLLLYAPLFFFSVANVTMVPSQGSVVCTATGVIALFFTHAFRNKKRTRAEKSLLILMIPSFLAAFLTGLIFPSENYKQDALAKNILIGTRNLISHITLREDDPIIELLDTATFGIKDPDWLIEAISSDQLTSLYATSKNLSKVGPFNPSEGIYLEVTKINNRNYDGTIDRYLGSCLYLKVESLDTYEDNMLTSSRLRMDVYRDDVLLPSAPGQYSVSIVPVEGSSVDITPYYTDLYITGLADPEKVNLFNNTNDENEYYASSPVPFKAGYIYTDDYVENYVYGTALEVPERTRDMITMSGVLPDWYVDCLYGRSDLSDCDKVRMVTEFVRDLHPYDRDTDYPPDNADFVPWFISEAESGICVHYAATTVILLRMIGIPARYCCGFAFDRAYANETSYVYGEEAHAWFEFFVPEYGWIMGDSTPGMGKMASNFNIEAVSLAYPEIEDAAFSRNRVNITDHNVHTATPTPTPAETTDTDETTSGEKTEYSQTEPSDPTETTAPDETDISEQPAQSDETSSPASPSDSAPSVQVILPGQSITFNSDSDPEPVVYVSINWEPVNRIVAVLLAIFAAIMVLLTARTGFIIYWRNKFSVKSAGEKIIAYYHYYDLMHRLLRKDLPSRAVAIVDKAAYSKEPVTKADLNLLIRTCNKSISLLSQKLPGFRKMLFMALVINIKPYK